MKSWFPPLGAFSIYSSVLLEVKAVGYESQPALKAGGLPSRIIKLVPAFCGRIATVEEGKMPRVETF